MQKACQVQGIFAGGIPRIAREGKGVNFYLGSCLEATEEGVRRVQRFLLETGGSIRQNSCPRHGSKPCWGGKRACVCAQCNPLNPSSISSCEGYGLRGKPKSPCSLEPTLNHALPDPNPQSYCPRG